MVFKLASGQVVLNDLLSKGCHILAVTDVTRPWSVEAAVQK